MATQSIQQGWGQMTAAQRSVIQFAVGAANGTRRTARRKKRAGAPTSSPKRKRARTRGASRSTKRAGKAHLVKGSAAAKRHMAKLRKMVGKRRR